MGITVTIEGINLEKLLRAAQEEGIILLGARRLGERRMLVRIQAADLRRMQALCEKSGWQMMEKKAGMGVRLIRFLKKRVMIVPSLMLCVLLVYGSSRMILTVHIENAAENAAYVRRILHEEGVRAGRLKAGVSFDDLRAKIAYRLPGLSFVSMRYAGSTLIVDCRPAVQGERLDIRGSSLDIVAAQSGVITRIAVSSGTPVVQEGQAVHRGQVLIRGEERGPQGSVIPVLAEGQVQARVYFSGEAKASLSEKTVVETGQTRTRVVMRSLWHERVIRDAEPFESQLVSKETEPVVGLYLPLWREITTYAQTEVFDSPRDRGDAASLAQGAAEEIAKKECPYGALILDKWVDYSMIDNEFMYATVVLEVLAPIAGRIL